MVDARSLKANYADDLLDDENVATVGIGKDDDGNEVLVIGVKDSAQAVSLPQGLNRQDYRIDEVGEFKAESYGSQLAAQNRQSEHRPVPGGVSVGHVDITAGTTSYLLTDGSDVYTASNNHVYANVNQGQQGDTIIQPGDADGGSSDQQSAELVDYVPIEDGVTVDVAWAEPVVEHTTDIIDIGAPQGQPRRAEVGETLTKSGRTTGVTEGVVNQIEASVDVNFGDAGTIRIEDLIVTEDMSDGGDSGSAVLGVDDNAPVGLLFAGSDTATAHCEAVNVEQATGLSIVTGDDGGGGNGGGTPTAQVTFTLESEGPDMGNITVDVWDQSGVVIEGAQVSIDGEVADSAQTSSDGIATFEEVPIGDYSITVSAEGYVEQTKAITESGFN